MGYNDNFIIAKQHPDKEEEIQARLFKPDSATGDYLLESAADTIWLSSDDSIYQKNGNWYHIGNGWNPPDSLKPNKAITYFHIIDIRNYERKIGTAIKFTPLTMKKSLQTSDRKSVYLTI